MINGGFSLGPSVAKKRLEADAAPSRPASRMFMHFCGHNRQSIRCLCAIPVENGDGWKLIESAGRKTRLNGNYGVFTDRQFDVDLRAVGIAKIIGDGAEESTGP